MTGGGAGAATSTGQKFSDWCVPPAAPRRRLSLLPVAVDVGYQAISPDGREVLLIAGAAGQQNLYVYPLDELRRILQLMVGELNASHLGVSPPPGSAPPSTCPSRRHTLRRGAGLAQLPGEQLTAAPRTHAAADPPRRMGP